MTTLQSWLPSGTENVFQQIKAMRSAAEAGGVKLVNLGVGQPQGVPLLVARLAASEAVMSEKQVMHEYQDNGEAGCPGFSRTFVQAHCTRDLALVGDRIDFGPIPGIKPSLLIVILACGASDIHRIEVVTATNPGYPTPATMCKLLAPFVRLREPELSSQNEFRFTIPHIEHLTKGDLLMLNYPHNPSGQVMTRAEWQKLCLYCSENGVRLFNDGAYSILPHSDEHCTLADVAMDYPNLSWLEAYSTSKVANMTGWRIGAVVGSADFVGDFKTMKGNIDSGVPAFLMHGVLKAFTDDRGGITAVQQMYQHRLQLLMQILGDAGMRLPVEPKAGFFSIWKVPKRAFGQEIKNAEHFNRLMINPLEGSGIIGVHFQPYIRYAVCPDIEPDARRIQAAFRNAKIEF